MNRTNGSCLAQGPVVPSRLFEKQMCSPSTCLEMRPGASLAHLVHWFLLPTLGFLFLFPRTRLAGTLLSLDFRLTKRDPTAPWEPLAWNTLGQGFKKKKTKNHSFCSNWACVLLEIACEGQASTLLRAAPELFGGVGGLDPAAPGADVCRCICSVCRLTSGLGHQFGAGHTDQSFFSPRLLPASTVWACVQPSATFLREGKGEPLSLAWGEGPVQ